MMGAANLDLSSKISDPIVRATRQCFETMLGSHVEAIESGLMTASCPGQVAALIRLSGDAQGLIELSFPDLTAQSVVRALLDFPPPVDEGLVRDCIGELANMIGGGAKEKLAAMKLSLGLPQIGISQISTADFPQAAQPRYLRFQSELGPFQIFFSLVGQCLPTPHLRERSAVVPGV